MTDYGTDVSTFLGAGFPDLDPNFGLISGPRVVAEAVARRLLTPRGSLSYDPTYGFDVRALLNEAITPSKLPGIAASVEAEATKDERVQSASATVTFNSLTQTLRISVLLTLASGPFTFVLTITSTTTTAIFAGK